MVFDEPFVHGQSGAVDDVFESSFRFGHFVSSEGQGSLDEEGPNVSKAPIVQKILDSGQQTCLSSSSLQASLAGCSCQLANGRDEEPSK